MIPRLTAAGRILMILLLTGALMAPVASPAARQETSASRQPFSGSLLKLSDDDLLVLEVRLTTRSTGHGLIAYQHGDSALLPLGELCSILELAIMVDIDQGTAAGWIIDEERTFELNLAAGTVARNGDLLPLLPGTVGMDDNDIYVRSDLLEQWLPVDLEISLPRMHVKITPRETLPFESRLKRDEQRSLWLASQGRSTLKYPMQLAPYRMWSWPLVDATAGLYAGRRTGSRRLALQSYSDLAGLSTNLFLSHMGNNERSQTITRLKAGRWNPEGRLLGPAAATQYEFGDLFISRIPLVSTRKQGLGFTISNQSLTRSREFDTTEIQGNAPPGWEAELYINGSLYDFQTIGTEGQYLFTEVPLIVGNNVFRTVLYGPRGERREIVKNANISAEMSEVRQLKYRATVVQEGRGMLNSTVTTVDSLSGRWNEQLELAYALNHRHALVANFSWLNVGGEAEQFSSLTSHNSLGRIYSETILAKSLRGGKAASLGARARLGEHSFFAQHRINDDYRAEAYAGSRTLARQTVLRSSGNLAAPTGQKFFYNLSATNRHYEESDLARENELKLHVSTRIGRLLVSHGVRYQKRDFTDGPMFRETLGTQLVRTQLGAVSLRGDLNYEIAPSRIRSTGASVNWYSTNRYRIATRATHFLRPEYGIDNAQADLTHFFDKFTLGINYSYLKDSGSAVGITLGTFLTRDIRSRTWAIQHRRMANRAVASVRAFIDLNGNQVFDPGDEPLPGVGFQNLTAWRKIRTNEDGIALLPGLRVHRAQVIELDLSTVGDPFLVPLSRGVNVIGHPGSFTEVEFPFSYVGEMEGVVTDAGHPEIAVRHVGLELRNRNGERVRSTVAEFDGYYYFADILPGEYELAVIPTTINTNRYEIPDPVAIRIPPEGGFVSGPEISLNRRPKVEPRYEVLASLPPTAASETVAVEPDTSPDPETAEQQAPPESVATAQETPPPAGGIPAAISAAAGPHGADKRIEPAEVVPVDDFDPEQTLSLIFELLHRNSLWPEESVQ